MATKKSYEEEEEERQYQQSEKERKAKEEKGKAPEDTSPSATGNAPGKEAEEVKPYKPAGPVEPGASDTGQEAPSVEQNKPEDEATEKQKLTKPDEQRPKL